jgi:hypothetical protein
MKKTIIILYIIFTGLGCFKKEELLKEEEVFAVINKFDEGWQNKKPNLVDSVLSDKYLYFTQSGHTFDRPNIISTAGSDIYKLQNMERESLTMQIEGNTAVVNTIWKGKGFYHGEEFNDKQRCSITIVKHDGKVKILAEHCTPIK